MKVEIKELPNLRVAAVRHTGPYNQIAIAFAQLNRIVESAGLATPDTALLAIFHDDPETTAQEQLRSEAGITVPQDARLPAELIEEHIPAGKYACTVHVGPYEQLGDTWARFKSEWLPASGHRIGTRPDLRDLPEHADDGTEGSARHGAVHADRVSDRSSYLISAASCGSRSAVGHGHADSSRGSHVDVIVRL